MAKELEYIHLEPTETCESAPTLIMMHGYGSNMNDLAGLQAYLPKNLRIICPQAPIDLSPLGMFGGHAWFHLDFDPMGGGIAYDEDSARTAVNQAFKFFNYVRRELADDPQRVYLLGFSQGAMMAHALLLDHPQNVAGAVCLSGRKVDSLFHDQREWHEEHHSKPLFISHGYHDEVIPYDDARDLEEYYLNSPVEVEYRPYNMGHEISMDCLNDLTAWLQKNIT